MKKLIKSSLLALTITSLGFSPISAFATDNNTAGMKMPNASSSDQTHYPLTIDNCGTSITFQHAPSKVILMNGASVAEVETMLALGLQKNILANSQSYGVSDDPTLVNKIKALPTDGLKINATTDDISSEQIIARKPDLVISTYSGGFSKQNGFNSRADLTKLGINSLVTPANCALGDPKPTAAENAAYAQQSIQSSYDLISLYGKIFNVQSRANQLVASMKSEIQKIHTQVLALKTTRPKAIIVFPDMSAMNQNGVPAIFSGGIWDSILSAAGVDDVFSNPSNSAMFDSTLSSEKLATISPDFLILGSYVAGENLNSEAQTLFKAYPSWPASQNQRYCSITDSMYLGPLNALAVSNIAKAAYPGKIK